MSKEETLMLHPERRRSARIFALEEKDRLEKEKEKEKKKAPMEANFNSNGNISINRRSKGKIKHKSLGELISATQGIQPPESKYYSSINGKEVVSVQKMPEKHALVFVLDLLQREFQCSLMAAYANHPREVEAYYHIKNLGFRTIRAKLRAGIYTELHHLEIDIYSVLYQNTTKNFNSYADQYQIVMAQFDSYNHQAKLSEYAWRLLYSLRTDPEKFKMEYGLISKSQSVNSDNAVHQDSDHSRPGSYGKNVSAPAIERRNSYKPFSNGKSRITEDVVAPKTIVTNNDGSGYKEILQRFVQDMGPIPKEIADKKIAQLEDALAASAAYGWQLLPTCLPETSNEVLEKEEDATFRSSILEDIENVSRIVREGNTENGGVNLEKTGDEEGGYMDLERYLKGKGICTVDNDDESLTLNNLNDNVQHEQQPISDLLAATSQWNSRNWMTYPTYKPKPMDMYTSGTADIQIFPTMVIGGRESKQEEEKSLDGASRPFWLPSQSEGNEILRHSLMAAKPVGYQAHVRHPLFPTHVNRDLQGVRPMNETESSMSLGGNGQYPNMTSNFLNMQHPITHPNELFDLNYCQNTRTDCSSSAFQGLPMEIDIWGQNMFPQQQVQVASSCDMAYVSAPGLSGPTEKRQVVNNQCLWERQLLSTPSAADEQPNLALQL